MYVQVTATPIANIHALEHQGVMGRPILPLPERISQRYDSVASHIEWVHGGLSRAELKVSTINIKKVRMSPNSLGF